jgi:hypothetical protein
MKLGCSFSQKEHLLTEIGSVTFYIPVPIELPFKAPGIVS